jgi:hypothetical protein
MESSHWPTDFYHRHPNNPSRHALSCLASRAHRARTALVARNAAGLRGALAALLVRLLFGRLDVLLEEGQEALPLLAGELVPRLLLALVDHHALRNVVRHLTKG